MAPPRQPFTLMMVKKLMSLHNKQIRHKGLWKMNREALYEYIRTQKLRVVSIDIEPYVKLEPIGARTITKRTEYVKKGAPGREGARDRRKAKSYRNPGPKRKDAQGRPVGTSGQMKQKPKNQHDYEAHVKERRATRNDAVPKRTYRYTGQGTATGRQK